MFVSYVVQIPATSDCPDRYVVIIQVWTGKCLDHLKLSHFFTLHDLCSWFSVKYTTVVLSLEVQPILSITFFQDARRSIKFPASCWTRRFIAISIRVHHWSLLWAKWIQSTLSHPVFLRSILISSHFAYIMWVISSLQVFPVMETKVSILFWFLNIGYIEVHVWKSHIGTKRNNIFILAC
jgi:hypothetical protein